MDKKKNYRPNVAAIILSDKYPHDCYYFVASRIDLDNVWQFPQGGIDNGESPKEALLRELKEEIGTDDVDIIAQYPRWISYDFPPQVAKRLKPYHGQKQIYFLVRLRDDDKVDINTKEPEFNEYKFMPYKKMIKTLTNFKLPVYEKVLKYFKKEGYL